MHTILVVDDELGVRQSFHMVLKDDFHVYMASSALEAIDIFSKNHIELVLLDIRLPDMDGVDLLRKLKDVDPSAEVIMVTAVKSIQTAVDAIKSGAYEYIIKPFDVEDVLTVINRALEKRRLIREVTYLRHELERVQPFEKMVGNDKRMREFFSLISTISQGVGAVLLMGESGTGKELAARAIHNLSPRKNQPFVVINCAAIPPSLMERELFGHMRGAFTGATESRMGKLEIANHGTVFLDDIDSLDIHMQAKLLRIIQEKEFERLGSTKVIKVDLRFVAACNKDIHKLIEKGSFREDLFYRLNVFPIELPPLRDRRSDIPLLLEHFLKLQTQHLGRPEKKFSEKAIEALVQYNWPGNVRELQNLVERLATITPEPVIRRRDVSAVNIPKRERELGQMTLKAAVEAFERQYISEFLEFYNGNRKLVAEKLGIHRNTLLTKLKEFQPK